jgi:hypothetical protein
LGRLCRFDEINCLHSSTQCANVSGMAPKIIRFDDRVSPSAILSLTG